MRRFGTITHVKPGMLAEYTNIHDNIPPEVVEAAHKYGLRNFTIFSFEDELFSYFEYVGDDFELDMAKKAELPIMQWWKSVCDACFLKPEGQDDFDIQIKEIFHNDF